jgi:hypothetical protein
MPASIDAPAWIAAITAVVETLPHSATLRQRARSSGSSRCSRRPVPPRTASTPSRSADRLEQPFGRRGGERVLAAQREERARAQRRAAALDRRGRRRLRRVGGVDDDVGAAARDGDVGGDRLGAAQQGQRPAGGLGRGERARVEAAAVEDGRRTVADGDEPQRRLAGDQVEELAADLAGTDEMNGAHGRRLAGRTVTGRVGTIAARGRRRDTGRRIGSLRSGNRECMN